MSVSKRRRRPLSGNMGTVSSGTMRKEDLIPAFLSALEDQRPLKREHRMMIREIERRIEKSEKLLDHEEGERYYESEDAGYDLNEGLFPALDEYSPEFFYFGAHPGDGADYGWWLCEEWERMLEEDDGVKVGDLSEVPKGHVGYVAVVNDHGNVTLWWKGRNGRLYERWSVV